MVPTWPTTHYPIKIVSILAIWTTNSLIPPTYVELTGEHRLRREGYYSLFLMAFPKDNLIIAHYMLIAWWLHLLDGLRYCVIHPGAIEQVLVIANNIITLGYTYVKHRLKKPPDVFYKIAHTYRLLVWIPSRLAWNPKL